MSTTEKQPLLASRFFRSRIKGTHIPDAGHLASDGELVLDSPQLVAREREIRLRSVEREIEEKVLRAIGIGHQPNKVLLFVDLDRARANIALASLQVGRLAPAVLA